MFLLEFPWHCGESWRKRSWDLDDEGGYVSFDGCDWDCGDQEDYEDDLKNWSRAWAEYHGDVAATGDDPLGEFLVPHTYTQRRAFVVEIRQGVGGAMVTRGKPKRGHWSAAQMPEPLADYLLAYTQDEQCNLVYGKRLIKDQHNAVAYTADEYVHQADGDDQVSKITQVRRFPSHLEHIGGEIRYATLHLWIEHRVDRKREAIARDLKRAARKALRGAQ